MNPAKTCLTLSSRGLVGLLWLSLGLFPPGQSALGSTWGGAKALPELDAGSQEQTPDPAAPLPGVNAAPLQEVLALVNAERQRAGVPPLVLNAQLSQAAQHQVQNLARQGTLSHTGVDGSTMPSRIEATGYSWSAIGENIALGQPSPQAVMADWMGNDQHRRNILNPAFSELGLAYLDEGGQRYWVQVFASPR
jgi:uncharacterized protein YkwD